MDGATLKLLASRRCRGGVGVTLLLLADVARGIGSAELNEIEPTTPAEWLPPALMLPTGTELALRQRFVGEALLLLP